MKRLRPGPFLLWTLLLAAAVPADPLDSFEEARGALARADFTAAAFHLLEAAEGGNREAQRELGRLYLEGKGVEASGTEAVRWLRQSAESGDGEAQLLLGKAYRGGGPVQASSIRSSYWLSKAAESGVSEARTLLQPRKPEAPSPGSSTVSVVTGSKPPGAAEYLAGVSILESAEKSVREHGRVDSSLASQALAFLKRMKHDPSMRARLAFHLASGDLGERDPAAAVELLRRDPAEYKPSWLNNIAYELAKQGVLLEEALVLAERATKAVPDQGEFQDTRAWILHRLGRNQEAGEIFAGITKTQHPEELALHKQVVEFALQGRKDPLFDVFAADLQKAGEGYLGRRVAVIARVLPGKASSGPHRLFFPIEEYTLALDTEALDAASRAAVLEGLGEEGWTAEVRGRLRRTEGGGPRYTLAGEKLTLVVRGTPDSPKPKPEPAEPPVRVEYTDLLLNPEKYQNRDVILRTQIRMVDTDEQNLFVRTGNATFQVYFSRLPKVIKRRLLEYKVSYDRSPIEVTGRPRKMGLGIGLDIDAHRIDILPGNPHEAPTVPEPKRPSKPARKVDPDEKQARALRAKVMKVRQWVKQSRRQVMLPDASRARVEGGREEFAQGDARKLRGDWKGAAEAYRRSLILFSSVVRYLKGGPE